MDPSKEPDIPHNPHITQTPTACSSPVLVSAPSTQFGTSLALNPTSMASSSLQPVVSSHPSSHIIVEEPLDYTFFDTPNGTRYWIPEVQIEFKPQVGMVFRTWDDVFSFYDSYAVMSGFSIRKCLIRKKKGELRYRYLTCNKAGKPQQNKVFDSLDPSTLQVRQSSFTMCDCKACIKVRCAPGCTEFEIYGFVEAHNHELVPPYNHDLMKQGRRLDFSTQQFIHQLSMQKVGPTQAHRFQVSLKGGHHNVQGTAADYKNFFRKVRMFIGDRDAKLVVEKLQARADNVTDFSFDYNIVDGELKSIFWADDISKINYQLFGDVLSFDATYHTNRYDMIFVPFTGVDSHNKCVTFGAGLLSSETIESYRWLLECFIKAHGKQPLLVLTDQDPSMRQAVGMVLNQSRHRLCMWHIMKKLPSKISGNLLQNSDIRSQIHKLVWSIHNKPTTFERKWQEIIETFGLQNNAWLSDMYALRELWVPSYFRELPICCLMKTTSRCESSNASFKVNSSSGNTLVQFLLCFDTTMDQQRYSQRLAQFKTNSTTPEFLTSDNIEKHAASVYTHSIFKQVSKEIHKASFLCFIINVDDLDGSKVYTVSQFNKQADLVYNFQVKVDISSQTYTCSCMGFHRIGFLCRHVFCVFRPFKIEKIPEGYILNRWSRDALPSTVFAIEKRYGVDSSEQSKLRLEITNMINECLDKLFNDTKSLSLLASKVRDMKDDFFQNFDEDAIITHNSNDVLASFVGEPKELDVECSNPQGIRNKGTRKTKRSVGQGENAIARSKKSLRQCKTCFEYVYDHDSRNCPKKKEAAASSN